MARRADSQGRLGWRLAIAAVLGGLALGAADAARAETLRARVASRGEPVAHAVVYAVALDARGRPAPPPAPTEIDQVDKEFVPYVSAVRVGTRIAFPNRDQIRHHVYSFSDAKTFEIPLYKGVPAAPVLFDKPGVVALGCNIHDWMRAYVFVAETPHFAVTDASGSARLALPSGRYAVEVWHPALKGEPEATRQEVALDGADAELGFSIAQRRLWRVRRAPSRDDPSYR